MSVRGGRGAREPMVVPDAGSDRRPNGYQRTGRYGRGPGDQRKYERYGNRGGGFGAVLRFVIFLAFLAAGVILTMVTVARPLVRAVIVPWANDNPSALNISFVADLVREDIGDPLTAPASSDPTEVEFVVELGDTPTILAPQLEAAGIIASQRAFLFEAHMSGLAGKLEAGRFAVALNLTPAGVVDALVNNRIIIETTTITFREGLRLEQMTAKLQTVEGTAVDPAAFLDIVTNPPETLLADYPWLRDEKVRPKGATLEGFLYPATYLVRVDAVAPSTADDLVRMMLDAFHERVGALLAVPETRGLSFYQVLVLASIVEREAVLDAERPLIAGVYQNRLASKQWPTRLLQSDPTIFYTNDSIQLAKLGLAKWPTYVFWAELKEQLPVPLPDALAGYNSYTSKGLPPGPLCSPAIASIEAALAPNTKTGYLFFVAKGDGSGSSAFAKTLAEHNRNVAKYLKKP